MQFTLAGRYEESRSVEQHKPAAIIMKPVQVTEFITS